MTDTPGDACGPGTTLQDGECLPTSSGVTCGDGTVLQGSECVADPTLVGTCSSGTELRDGACVLADAGCGVGTVRRGEQCLVDGDAVCAGGTTFDDATSRCEPEIRACGEATALVDGACLPTSSVCGPGSAWDADAAVCEASCGRGTVLEGDACAPDGTVLCDAGTTFDAVSGTCTPDITACAERTVLVAGECVAYDDTVVGEVTEPSEPNGFGGTYGAFTLPAMGESITISGCIAPYVDRDGNGNLDPDEDIYMFSVTEPTLVEVSVDGLNGMAGGFYVMSSIPALLASWWTPLGWKQRDDVATRQVYLPAAGEYALVASDGRSLMSGEGAGDGQTCYLATVRHLALPSPVVLEEQATLLCEDGTTACVDSTGCAGIGDGLCRPTVVGALADDVQFFSYSAQQGETLTASLVVHSEAVAPAILTQVNGVFSSYSWADAEQSADIVVPNLGAGDSVIITVDSLYNLNLLPADYLFTVAMATP